MSRRCTWMVALAIALFATGGASAGADTITVTAGPDPTEEVPLPVTVSWTSGSTDQYAFVTIKPAGSLGCATNHATDEATSEGVLWEWTGSVTGSRSATTKQYDPGAYILCAYLQSGASATVPAAASGPVPLTIRSARASVSLKVTPHADASHRFSVSAAVTSELGRWVFVTVAPAGGRGCEAQHTRTSPALLIRESGEGVWTATRDYTAPDDGVYLVCAYVQEGLLDAPEATASSTFRVGPDRCVTAKAALAAARKAVRRAESAVARYRKRSQRYRTAIRVRAKERRKLERARRAVAREC